MSTPTIMARRTVAERSARGEAARKEVPVSAHADWRPPADRPDPVALLVEQNTTREADLVPVRHGRMMVSPFTFYRGAAKIMATDLAGTPTAGLEVQLCGDGHLSNFGGFASPERTLLFGLNDFDETLPGPFEYDVKRMSASFTIAAINNGLSVDDIAAVTRESVRAYRAAMAEFAAMRTLDVWYAHISEAQIEDAITELEKSAKSDKTSDKGKKGKKDRKGEESAHAAEIAKAGKTARKTLRKAHSRDSLHALPRLAALVGGRHQIISEPPVLIPLRELAHTYGMNPDQAMQTIEDQFRAYTETLPDDRRQLLARFSISDAARKVVGVGSVGTRAWIVLLEGRDSDDPLFLQVKEATRSVLEAHLPGSRYENPGERVVQGQRLMQSASDIFLGWTKGVQDDRFYYWRQLRDMKASAVVDAMGSTALTLYARLCGWTLAHAHARSGDAVAIAEYLGRNEDFENALTAFSALVRRAESARLRRLRRRSRQRPDRRRRRRLAGAWSRHDKHPHR